MRSKKVRMIRSGGQTGADRAALDFAIAHHIEYAGWVPKNGWAEDYPKAPGVVKDYPNLRETKETTVNQRTIRNVRDADATLIVYKEVSPGTELTYETAKTLHKPIYCFSGNVDGAYEWFSSLPSDIVLNVGGPRASEKSGVYDETYKLLEYLFEKD